MKRMIKQRLPSGVWCTRPRVLLLGDSQARFGGDILTDLLPNFEILNIFKPNATTEKVLENVSDLTRHFTNKDFVILMCGTNDALCGTRLNIDFMEDVGMILRNTNVILCSTPYWNNRSVLNQFIYDINTNMYNVLNGGNTFYIDTNRVLTKSDFTRHGLHMNRSGRVKLFSAISFLIRNVNYNCLERNFVQVGIPDLNCAC